MESDDENLVIEQMQLNVSDESLPGEAAGGGGAGGGGGGGAGGGENTSTVPPINHNLIESEWDTFQSSIARQVQSNSILKTPGN